MSVGHCASANKPPCTAGDQVRVREIILLLHMVSSVNIRQTLACITWVKVALRDHLDPGSLARTSRERAGFRCTLGPSKVI